VEGVLALWLHAYNIPTPNPSKIHLRFVPLLVQLAPYFQSPSRANNPSALLDSGWNSSSMLLGGGRGGMARHEKNTEAQGADFLLQMRWLRRQRIGSFTSCAYAQKVTQNRIEFLLFQGVLGLVFWGPNLKLQPKQKLLFGSRDLL
jgi:hypothetical protein